MQYQDCSKHLSKNSHADLKIYKEMQKTLKLKHFKTKLGDILYLTLR